MSGRECLGFISIPSSSLFIHSFNKNTESISSVPELSWTIGTQRCEAPVGTHHVLEDSRVTPAFCTCEHSPADPGTVQQAYHLYANPPHTTAA